MELSIILPCLNEELTVGTCVAKAINFLKKYDINGEVIVADNGSTDRSIEIAIQGGRKLLRLKEKDMVAPCEEVLKQHKEDISSWQMPMIVMILSI